MYKLPLYVFSLSALSLACLTPTSAFAKNQSLDFQVQSINSTSTDVGISWSSGADHFAVYHDGQLVYQGKNNSFDLSNVTPHTDYNLSIVAYDENGNVIGKSKVQASTLDSKTNLGSQQFYSADSSGNLSFSADSNNNIVLQHGTKVTFPVSNDTYDTSFNSNFLNAAVNDSSVVLRWGLIPGVQSYQIFRNGIQIGTVTNEMFTDFNIQSGQQYIYEIKSYRPMDSVRTEKMKEFVKEHHLSLTPQDKLSEYNDSFDAEKQINTSLNSPSAVQTPPSGTQSMSQSAVSPLAATFPYYHPSFTVGYNCFIPSQYIANPWDSVGTAKYAYFGGDNRGFNAYASTYRTKSTVTASFGSYGESINMTPSIGQSRGYNSNYQLIGTATASSNGITMGTPSLSSSKIQYTINHSVSNPLTTAPAIDYSYTANLYSDGHVNISGWHDQAPDHEVYLYTPYFQTLHQATVVDYYHLFPWYPKNYWSWSNMG